MHLFAIDAAQLLTTHHNCYEPDMLHLQSASRSTLEGNTRFSGPSGAPRQAARCVDNCKVSSAAQRGHRRFLWNCVQLCRSDETAAWQWPLPEDGALPRIIQLAPGLGNHICVFHTPSFVTQILHGGLRVSYQLSKADLRRCILPYIFARVSMTTNWIV